MHTSFLVSANSENKLPSIPDFQNNKNRRKSTKNKTALVVQGLGNFQEVEEHEYDKNESKGSDLENDRGGGGGGGGGQKRKSSLAKVLNNIKNLASPKGGTENKDKFKEEENVAESLSKSTNDNSGHDGALDHFIIPSKECSYVYDEDEEIKKSVSAPEFSSPFKRKSNSSLSSITIAPKESHDTFMKVIQEVS